METTSPKFFCFVLMPFSSEFDDIYKFGIKESCKDANAYCERVDEQIFEGTILQRIYNQIAKSDLIIADMTGRNPNVFYEVGYAHALNKPTVLLTQKAKDIPFDMKHFPHIIYGGKIDNIKNELTKRVLWFKNNSKANIREYKTEIDVYIDREKLEFDNLIFEYPEDSNARINIVVENVSSFTYKSGEFQIGIICKAIIYEDDLFSTTILPDNTYLHMLPFVETLFPNAFASHLVRFTPYDINGNEYSELDITLKVFTNNGTRSYKFKLKQERE